MENAENAAGKKCCPICKCPCPCKCVKMLIPVLIGFAFIVVYDYFLHMVLLKPQYDETPALWRADMQKRLPIMLAFQFLTATVLFAFHKKGFSGSCKRGIHFSLKAAILLGVFTAYPYIFLPVAPALGLSWFAGGFVKGLGVGMIYSMMARCCRKGEKTGCGCGCPDCKCGAGSCGTGEDKTGACG